MYRVSLLYQNSYTLREVREKLENILTSSWDRFPSLKPGDRILLKPNLLSGKSPESAVTTHPVVVEAMIQILLDRGCRVTIGDSPALQKFLTVAKKTGLLSLKDHYPIHFQELDTPVTVEGIPGGVYKSFEISRYCLESDYLINLAKFKTHSMMGLTLSIKNLFGCIPGKKKAAWHLAIGKNRDLFARLLSELAAIIPANFHVIDGIVGMEGNGPGNGTPLPLGVLLGGENASAVDIVAARLVGLAPQDLLTCKASAKMGFGPADETDLLIVGDRMPEAPFPFTFPEPMRTDWHLPTPLKRILRWILLPLPKVLNDSCKGCLDCQKVCPPGAIQEKNGKAFIQEAICIRCYCCQEICPENAIVFRKNFKEKSP